MIKTNCTSITKIQKAEYKTKNIYFSWKHGSLVQPQQPADQKLNIFLK